MKIYGRHSVRWLCKHETGAATVEMALVLPVFLLLVLGIMEFGRAYWTLNSMQIAIDEAGRYAMINVAAPDSQIISVAQSNLYGLNPNDFTVTSQSKTINSINYKVITATYTFSFIAPGVLPFGNITLTRQTTVPLVP
ncbi:MAG: pilus assembly protein [Pseudomonadota bacterium]|nr:pilus assembly protein [Pseudomonadota bacterium]